MFSKIYLKYDRILKKKLGDFPGLTRLSFFLYKLAERNIEKVEGGESVFEMEWDNLIILDACRFDTFRECYDGEIDSRISLGSSTLEYMEKNFSSGNFVDTIYVTGNPHFHPSQFKNLTGRNLEDVFHSVFHTYQTDWDKDANTVLPEPLIRDAKTARNLFEDENLVIHFMQPHYPFVNSDLAKGGINPELDDSAESVWRKAEKGEYSRKEVYQTYESHLEFVLPKAKELAETLEGKTVITSDHGNLVGENGLYGHPSRARARCLRKVPLLVIYDE
ncbi:MAG: hypothetical protein BRC29_00755 [Nanohaloarchaea archaeon SW_7_43_1]|nr:MAG: hypothetical protein BRC29_00755 [Nanohaloarchaea archaeon SW_7_43_1]